MAVKKYDAAVAYTDSAALTIRFANGVLGDVALLTSPPSPSALDSMGVADAAAGWPLGVVDLSRQKRAVQTHVWHCERGVHIGSTEPPLAMLYNGDGHAAWLDRVWGRTQTEEYIAQWGCSANVDGYGKWISTTDPTLGRLAMQHTWREFLNSSASREKMLNLVTKTVVPYTMTDSFAMPSTATRAQVIAALQARRIGGHCLWAVKVVLGDNITGTPMPGGGALIVFGQTLAVGAFSGLRISLWDGPVTGSPTAGVSDVLYTYVTGGAEQRAINREKRTFKNVYIEAEQGLIDLLVLLHGVAPANANSWTISQFSDAKGIDVASDYSDHRTVGVSAEGEYDAVGFALPGLTNIIGGGGPDRLGIRVYSAYVVGAPQFVMATSVEGSSSIGETVAGHPMLVVDDKSRMFVWSGAFLKLIDDKEVELGVRAQSNQVSDPSTVLVRSTVLNSVYTVPTDPLKLTDLYAKAIEAEVAIEDEVCLQAEGEYPAVTLGQASKNASGQKAQTFHQLYRSKSDLGSYSRWSVHLTGTNGAVQFTAVDELGVTQTDPAEVAFAIAAGAPVTNGSSVSDASDAIAQATGLASTDRAGFANAYSTLGREFDESSYQYQDVFNPVTMSTQHAAAYAVMAYARPREQLNSAVTAFVSMGRLASKKMITRPALKAV